MIFECGKFVIEKSHISCIISNIHSKNHSVKHFNCKMQTKK